MAIHSLPDLVARLKVDTTGLAKAEAEAASFTGRLGALLAGVAVIGAALVAGLVAGGAVAVKAAANFQIQMTQLKTGAGELDANLSLVSSGILKMAGEVGTSASELAKGMFMIESAGFHGAAGLEVLQKAAEGAKVGNASLATTADAVTTILRDYHMPATKAADATNFLVSVVSQGKTHMEDLAGALSAILPTASALHVPLAQVGGAMATLTARGVPAADAATYLRFTLSALAGPSHEGEKAMNSIGLTTKQVGDKLTKEGLLPALELIQTHLTKKFPHGGAQMFATLKEITGGTRGLGAALGLTGDNLATFEAAVKKVAAQIAGGHGEVIGWKDVQADFNTQMDKAKFAIEAAGIKIGMILLPYAQQLLRTVVPLIPVVADWASKMATQLMPQIERLANWLSTMGPNLQKAYDIFRAWAPFILALAAAWVIWNLALLVTEGLQAVIIGAQFIAGLAAIISKVGLLTAAQWLLNIALDANPIGVVILAIAALALGVIWAYQNVGWFHDAVDGALGGLIRFKDWIWTWLKPALDWLGQKLSDIGGFLDSIGGKSGSKITAAAGRYGGVGTGHVNVGRQHGGMVIPGGIYTVGEAGPETLVMGRNGGGMVIPNAGNTYNYHLSLSGQGAVNDPEGVRRMLQRMQLLGAGA